ncbi:Outer membrane receptor proteins, mostly Fe transport [Gillisia sp. Hel1_33_143]|uniref:TonB-dependent receptor n=1 Tax=Gillisia sp. Hel1_33_143 TaxID=1336796 RepID=UPI00087CE05C|nr:TonB-dependent receptor [Gillisia sp. Hel1_33_143]SDR74105.1 Outer membrane receptor proteins, mostly Fe transport [Gillisia sp. Hel1_33_143]
MKNFLLVIALFLIGIVQAQEPATTGSIAGKLSDKEMSGEPLPFANVIIKGTSTGTTSDFDGLYTLQNLAPGTYTVSFSFIGYETLDVPNVIVVAGKVTEVNTELGASAASLDEVVIKTVSRRDSEVALLLEQKGAVEIKESIGAQELAKMGVSDAAAATTKISGVTSSEASGDIFVRGLGDRYLYTTMNGLPIPSDDVENKNIDLGLFPTKVIQNVSISKTYAASSSADQASGNIDITSRELRWTQELTLGIDGGINTNAVKSGVGNNFKVSPNSDDITLGFYSKKLSPRESIINQSWSPETANLPVNTGYSISGGKKIGDKLSVFLSGSQSTNFEHREGVFREFRANFINDSILDAEIFSKSVNTTGLATLTYRVNDANKVTATSLFINKLSDEVYEGGRNGEGVIFEETAPSEGLAQFIRDQNIKQTRLWINQLIGDHNLTENNELNWAIGYNRVDADEPNRIRNEVNFNDDFVQLGRNGGFQQRKSGQAINDEEYNGLLSDKMTLINEETQKLSLTLGGNYRNKQRDFVSQFLGVEERITNLLNPSSIDNISEIFTPTNFNNGSLIINRLQPDRYAATLESAAGFVSANYEINKFNINLGVRYQNDNLYTVYNVGNIPGRVGRSEIAKDNFYPSLNVRYALNDKTNLRLATSKTLTLPEFKEFAPFEYVSQTGQVIRGNPDLQASTNYNLDIKYEFFPTAKELISLTGFYKRIEDPINKVQDRGSAGIFSFFNSGDKAEIYGLELETRMGLIQSDVDLDLTFNASKMWHTQDLKETVDANGNFIRTFRYKGLTETGLQGASDWILNSSLNFSDNKEDEFNASITANYASDKIYALGAPEIQTQSATFYNDAIIEKGFVSLDANISKDLGEHFNISLSGKNLLNPNIERTQKVRPSTTGVETTQTVRSYTTGSVLKLGVKYNF